ncbi:autophagy protein Apg9-domain-containing protein [Plectosphaerella plurivora]|uniref:Autophagy-related protein 9 n=1 Tax=Plectosphaerella plurivora TaxID=936078 RepID=A0A9P9A6I4_9PEZI|nr:autophagy protein Apg9-domain-containing protein [Plectosphaerella plurivora]
MSSGVSSLAGSRTNITKSFYQQLRGTNTNGIDARFAGEATEHGRRPLLQRFSSSDNVDDFNPIPSQSEASEDGMASPLPNRNNDSTASPRTTAGGSRPTAWRDQEDEADNDVPGSLLVELHGPRPPIHADKRLDTSQPRNRGAAFNNPPRQGRTYADRPRHPVKALPKASPRANPMRLGTTNRTAIRDPRELALWRWANVTNLDVFMKDVYEYYLGSGFWCIICERVLHLVQSAFVAVFLTFLTQCIDYSLIHKSNALSEVVRSQCTKNLPWYWNLGLWLFVFYVIWKAVQFSVDTRRLLIMRDFFTHLLDIPEQDMQTVSWQDIVARVMTLRDANPHTAMNMTPSQRRWLQAHSKERLDAVDIASRIMRKDNYLIALINKDTIDFSLPIPFMRDRQFFSGTLQWWLYFSVIDLVFDLNGQVNQQFLKASSRGLLSRKLRNRLVFAGLLNLLGSPFWVCHQVLIHLLSYYNEFKKDSGTLGDRRYTALAKWKFREFNELPHFFQERINMSYPFASRYMDQFPKRGVEQIAQAVTFMSGAVTFVLAAASFLGPEHILTFQITHERPLLFYIGVFGTIWAIARGMISEETLVFSPEFALKGVTDFIHYTPDHWRGRLHSFDVKKEFSELYKLKIVILAEEIIGIFLASFILLYSVTASSERIVDFFREFTIHVDGLGYVCSFAEFEFRQDGPGVKQTSDAAADVRGDYYATKHGKMAASYYGFLESYVHNPKSGMTPGHVPPSFRQQFHPPPAFPGLDHPTSGADVVSAMGGRNQRRSTRVIPPGLDMVSPSPLASVLLDPHHQPRMDHPGQYGASGPRARGRPEDSFLKRGLDGDSVHNWDEPDDEPYESGGPLGESTWQTSPGKKPLTRADSDLTAPSQDAGVLGLIYQFQQVNRDNRMGGGGS